MAGIFFAWEMMMVLCMELCCMCMCFRAPVPDRHSAPAADGAVLSAPRSAGC